MFTRPFTVLLAAIAVLAVGIGVVVGTRTPHDETRVTHRPSTSTDDAKKPAADLHEEAVGTPGTKAVSLAQAKATDVAPQGLDANKVPSSFEEVGANRKAQAPTSSKSITHEAADAGEASKGAAATTPRKSEPVDASSSESELVFVSRASLMKAQRGTSEAVAIATLRSVSSAQAQLQSSGAIDTDGDGVGEYGYFAEMAGAVPIRVAPGEKPAMLQPPLFSREFTRFTANDNVVCTGYLFRMYLPGATVAGNMPGIAETPRVGSDAKNPRTDHDNCEIRWCCYAWPIEAGTSGTRAFFMDQEGDMLVLANTDGAYSGDEHAPAFDAASTRPGDMPERTMPGAKYADGRAWSAYASEDLQIPSFELLGPATAADVEKYNREDSKEDRVVLPRANLVQAIISTAESKAITSLRMISEAQAQAQSAGVIDTDEDSRGEYGFFGELAGTAPCRAPARDKRFIMEPHVLSSSWGKVTKAGNVVIDGYVYRMYLPAPLAKRKSPGSSEAPGGGSPTGDLQPDHDGAEVLWSAYAWPLEPGKTGQRAFFVNQEGDMLMLANKDGAYSGEDHAPAFDAALRASQPGDMRSAPAIGVKSVDGRGWAPVQ